MSQTTPTKIHRCFFQMILFGISSLILIISIHILHPPLYALDWDIRNSPHFSLYYQKKDRLLADYIMQMADKDYERIIADIGIDPGIKAKAYLAPDRDIYKALQPKGRKTHEWSIGVYYPEKNLILLLSSKALKLGRPDLRKVMAHELTHFILFTITKDKEVKLPTWLHEGLAIYEARQWGWHYRRIMTQTSLSRSFIPLSALIKGFPEDKRLAERAYAQSISLIAYIINKHGQESLHKIIKSLVEGRKAEDAFYNALGINLKEFERRWHAYLRRHYTWIPFLTSSFAIWFIITLMALLIYIHKKHRTRQKMSFWEIEDQIDYFDFD